MESLHAFERAPNGLVWGWSMIVLLMRTGVLLTVLTNPLLLRLQREFFESRARQGS